MAAAGKLSQQPRTESCVVSGNGPLRSVDREFVGRNSSEREYGPEIDRGWSSRPCPARGKAESQEVSLASLLGCFRGSYRRHAGKGMHVNKGAPFGSNASL